tara:strand:+ start:935 stop:1129 length:195 start_codon:yes stop_codon:yes gene_type:complete
MTIIIFDMHLSLNLRNGFGFDIEAASARPIWITDNLGDSRFAVLDGLVICLPFCIITYGSVYEE